MFSVLPVLLVVSGLQANQPIIIEQEAVHVELTPRSPNQMGSFYEARGFPEAVRAVLAKQCYITIGILNKSKTTLWFDLKDWTFSVEGKEITRQHRDYWRARWQEMGLAQSKQSTFRWTLIPEQLDYLPGEKEGGNIILPFTDKMITVDAKFATGKNKQGKPVYIHYDKLYCAQDKPE